MIFCGIMDQYEISEDHGEIRVNFTYSFFKIKISLFILSYSLLLLPILLVEIPFLLKTFGVFGIFFLISILALLAYPMQYQIIYDGGDFKIIKIGPFFKKKILELDDYRLMFRMTERPISFGNPFGPNLTKRRYSVAFLYHVKKRLEVDHITPIYFGTKGDTSFLFTINEIETIGRKLGIEVRTK